MKCGPRPGSYPSDGPALARILAQTTLHSWETRSSRSRTSPGSSSGTRFTDCGTLLATGLEVATTDGVGEGVRFNAHTAPRTTTATTSAMTAFTIASCHSARRLCYLDTEGWNERVERGTVPVVLTAVQGRFRRSCVVGAEGLEPPTFAL